MRSPAPEVIDLGGGRTYELLDELGAGGMGRVHLARAVGIGGFQRLVAIKVCHRDLAKDDRLRAMLLDEARVAARIHHPNVVATFDVGETDVPYLVMEYVEGAQLSTLAAAAAKRGEPVPAEIAVRIMLDALAGLEAAHNLTDDDGQPLGLVHRDVCPANIIVGADGISRILDFGVAKVVTQSRTTKEGNIKGKLPFMSPEYLDRREVGRFTDTYSAGIVLWELLAGRALFEAETEAHLLRLVLQAEVPPLASVRPDLPPALDAVVRKATHRIPGRRYATAAAFAEALEQSGVAPASARVVGAFVERLAGDEFLRRRSVVRRSPSVSSHGGAARGRRRRTMWLAAGAGLVVAAALAVWWAGASSDPSPTQAVPAPSDVPEAAPVAVAPPASEAPAAAPATAGASPDGEGAAGPTADARGTEPSAAPPSPVRTRRKSVRSARKATRDAQPPKADSKWVPDEI